ncbi:MAG: purine-nucleoside phosphorylase [Prolixibacteraceae bacterium]|nr:purine-nucleoside phosphorylase [Prolixibacteraceae bacterium]MBN2650419.1 purine-nucleoside phosphorylase [Prolixibacteraceae bacterium]
MLQKIKATANFIKDKTDFKGRTAIILGSGLGNFVDKVEVQHSLSYKDIPNFPVSTIAGHAGKLIIGRIKGKQVLVMQGRFHYYEGWSMYDVTFPVRVFKMMGVENLLVSNAAGGTNYSFEVGDLMMITDHINLFGTNPLIGQNEEELGPRFPNMSKAYDSELCEIARSFARSNNFKLNEGVYVGLTGPSFETNAEYRFLNTIGGDAVGMSTVPEVIVANHMAMRVFGVSVITNNGLDIPEEGNSHKEVLDVAVIAGNALEAIFSAVIEAL